MQTMHVCILGDRKVAFYPGAHSPNEVWSVNPCLVGFSGRRFKFELKKVDFLKTFP